MNRPTHMLVAGCAATAYLANQKGEGSRLPVSPVVGGIAASVLTNLPDVLEPATSPNHRAFFHSFAFAALLIAGMGELHRWQPEDEFDRFLRTLGLLAGGAYLVHLALDFTTKRSLPLLGRL